MACKAPSVLFGLPACFLSKKLMKSAFSRGWRAGAEKRRSPAGAANMPCDAPAGAAGRHDPESSWARQVAACTASITTPRKPPCSRAWSPAMVVPPGEAT